jgi:hypothetical protein
MQAKKLRARIKEDDYDVPAWRALLDDLRGCPLSDDCRSAWEELVGAFPSTVSPDLPALSPH